LKSGPFVTRFAPSPTGYMHRGHAYSASTAYRAARDADGQFLLRIEDIDPQRCRPHFEAAIYEDLAWLGIRWDAPVRRQSEHMDDYLQALAFLSDRGLLYRCFKTRAQVLDEIGRAPHGAMNAYRGEPLAPADEARFVAEGLPFAWRLSLAEAERHLGGLSQLTFRDDDVGLVDARPEVAGDVVLARKDVGVAYHLAVVVDDALQGVTKVIRGEDLFEATHIQRLLQALLELPTPDYRHHRLMAGPDGKRFAKRDQAETLREIRASGVSPQALLATLAA
jgi:glutamyl-Q tRNA(Asp) synthetase